MLRRSPSYLGDISGPWPNLSHSLRTPAKSVKNDAYKKTLQSDARGAIIKSYR